MDEQISLKLCDSKLRNDFVCQRLQLCLPKVAPTCGEFLRKLNAKRGKRKVSNRGIDPTFKGEPSQL